MKRARSVPADLRLGDVTTFFAVQRCGSVTGAARDLGTSPSHVSKAIARLEAQLRLSLLSRGVHGVALTDEALRILPDLEQAVRHLSRVLDSNAEEQRTLAVAAPSYLITLFLPVMAEAQPHLRFCGLELPPAMVRARAAENFFDLCLMAGRVNLPSAWYSKPLGPLRRSLLARPPLAKWLGSPATIEKVRSIPFITPVYTANGQFVQADDDCPLSLAERRPGHKVQTIQLALELAASVDQLVFGPVIAARRQLDEGRLVEVPVKGWRSSETLTLACNPERLLAQELKAISEAVQQRLDELGVLKRSA
jgi:DNA-binding transcriptional LysR family regulator